MVIINNEIKDEYEKEKIKRKEWENQIERSKYKCAVQCIGYRCCTNWHTFSGDNIGCWSCGKKGVEFNQRLLYLVDEETHYEICHNCERVRKINEKLACYYGAESYSKIKFNSCYKPWQIHLTQANFIYLYEFL